MTFVKRQLNKNHHKLYQFPALATLIYVDSGDCSPYRQVNGPP